MRSIRIEPVRMEDLEEIYSIELECFGDEAYSRSLFEGFLIYENSIFLKALVDDTVAGFAVGAFRRVRGKRLYQLYTIDVKEKFRGCGIGSALLKAFEERARELGAEEVILQVRVDNRAAVNLYLKHGYRIVRRIKGYYGAGKDAYEAVKKL